MFNRVACSLREKPSKVQPYQAGLDKKDREKCRRENAGLRKTTNRPRELRGKPRNNLNSFSWNPGEETDALKPRLFEGLLSGHLEQHQVQSLPPQCNQGRSQETAYSYGTLVWAKFSKTWWPAIVVDGFLAKVDPPKKDNVWVMWFGDHKVSEVSGSAIELFTSNFIQRSEGKHSSSFDTGITEALKICADRAKKDDLLTYNSIRDWGRSETGFQASAKQKPELFSPDEDCPYPPMVFRVLRKIANMHSAVSDSESDSDSLPDMTRPTSENQDEMTHSKPLNLSVMEGNFCLSCAKSGQNTVSQHPLFEGSLCVKCQDSVMETFFALDEDGHYLFCTICGEGGLLLMCEKPDCGRSYCMKCLYKFIDHSTVKKLKSANPWACFVCTPYQMETHGLLKPQENWQENVLILFNPRCQDTISMDCLISLDTNPKRKLRVLSLFDGICTVKYVLDQLGFEIEVYYASEIDAAAELVTMFNHGFSVSQLGDVLKLERTTLKEICSIDLLVGSPPCDDLDISNKDYKGFNGSGVFMFMFLLILKDLEILSEGRPIYWLLEATANMKAEYRHVLTNFFEGPPALWDAQYFTAYLQPRYYWGNLPNMYSVLDYFKKQQVFTGTIDHELTEYLAPNLDRKAMVSKLRSVAIDTKPDPNRSENEDEDRVDYCLPVLMEGRKSEIWVNEIEKVLGFPEHYTDVSQMTIRQRQKLLKQASCVHVLKHLLSPLTSIYATK